jgi:Acyltransferase family
MVFGSLTAMRGVAALLVAFFHLRYGVIGVPLFDLYIFQFRFGNRGYLWVDFFFILSGFILACCYGDACSKLNLRGYGHFVWQRVARIWPLNAVTVLIAIVYLGSKYGASYLRRDAIVANLLLVHGWGHYFAPPLDFPSWSLSCEWGGIPRPAALSLGGLAGKTRDGASPICRRLPGIVVMVLRSLWKWNTRSAQRKMGTRSLSDRGGHWSEFVSIECALSVAKNGTNI